MPMCWRSLLVGYKDEAAALAKASAGKKRNHAEIEVVDALVVAYTVAGLILSFLYTRHGTRSGNRSELSTR
jgi:hypothetical protein